MKRTFSKPNFLEIYVFEKPKFPLISEENLLQILKSGELRTTELQARGRGPQ